jgi:hypothetical protein
MSSKFISFPAPSREAEGLAMFKKAIVSRRSTLTEA